MIKSILSQQLKNISLCHDNVASVLSLGLYFSVCEIFMTANVGTAYHRHKATYVDSELCGETVDFLM